MVDGEATSTGSIIHDKVIDMNIDSDVNVDVESILQRGCVSERNDGSWHRGQSGACPMWLMADVVGVLLIVVVTVLP